MANKATVKYVPTPLPAPTGGQSAGNYARIVERKTYGFGSIIEGAIDAGYISGSIHECRAKIAGIWAYVKAMLEQGARINLDWLSIEMLIKGKLDANNQITDDNNVAVHCTALQALKLDKSNFSFTNTEDTTNKVVVDKVFSIGGTPGYVVKSKPIGMYGRNLYYRAALGDTVAVTYIGLDTPIYLTPTETDYSHMQFAWPTALDELDDGKVLTFTCNLHGGVEGSKAQTRTINAIYKTA